MSSKVEGETPAGTASGRESPAQVPLWRNRDFMLLWTGQALSATGSSMTTVVYPLLALAATHSAAMAGVISFAGMTAAALVWLIAGALADRYPLKPLMILPDLVRAVATLWIVVVILSGHVTIPELLVVSVVSATCGAIFDSAQAVAIRHVVPVGKLSTAMAQNTARGHLASLVGQPLGGYLYGVGVSVPVVADTLSYFVGAVLTALVRSPARPHREQENPHTIWRDIAVGLRHVAISPFLRVTLACAVGFNFLFAGLTIAIIASQSTRGHSAFHVGTALRMGAIGGVLGAWAATPMNKRLSPATLIYLFGWICCLALALLGQVHNTYLVGTLLAAMFFIATPANGTLFAAQIDATPPELQGRVVSAAMLSAGIAAPAGPPLAGLLFDSVGQGTTFFLYAGLAGAITVVMHASTSIRTMRRPGARPSE